MRDLRELMKTGRKVTTRDGEEWLVIRDVESCVLGHQEWALVNSEKFSMGDSYDKSLKALEGVSSGDIMKVEQRYEEDTLLTRDILNLDSKNVVIWERGNLAIKGVHFGSNKEYSWLLGDVNAEIGDVVEVETTFGTALVQVRDVFTTTEDYKAVIRVVLKKDRV